MIRECFDIVIVGGGIVGTACAAACAQEGFSVALVEAESIGGGATAEGMGHVVVLDDSPAQFALSRYSQQLWDELAPDLSAAAEFQRCGTIWVAADDEEMEAVRNRHEAYSELGVATQVLGATTLYEMEAQLRPGLAGGLLVPGDSVVYPPFVAAQLAARAQEQGARMLTGRGVTEITSAGVILADGEQLSAEIVINAAGMDSPTLTADLPMRRRKGHLVITDRHPGFARHQLIEMGYLKSAHASDADSVAFNIQPRSTGQLLIGSSRQFDADRREVEPVMIQRMLQRAFEYMPDLARLTAVRSWTGFRAATPDGLPLIGPHPDFDGLYLATGHEGLGITTSLGTARLLVDQLKGRAPQIPAEPYLPARLLKNHER